MAGIGFEIKKIYDKKNISSKLIGLTYTSFVSIGPTVICVLMLLAIREITGYYKVAYFEREALNSAILYAFVFSLLFVSGKVMIVTRHLSDAIYSEKLAGVFSSLVGIVTLTLLTSGGIGIIFYSFSPLALDFKLLSYILYIELSLIFILMVYVSAIRNYKLISNAFVVGVLLSVGLSLLFIEVFRFSVVTAILIGLDVGFLINILIQLTAIHRVFSLKQQRYFEFVEYLSLFPKLYYINLFYTLGLFVHNMIFWAVSDYKLVVANTFVTAPAYDTASFYSLLTILPAIVIFVLKVETSFYVKHKAFLTTIVNGGSLTDLKKAQKSMAFTIEEELNFVMEIQLLISIVAVAILTKVVFPYIGVSTQSSELFTFLAFGYYAAFMAFLITTILLYFDRQQEAFAIQAFFVGSNALLTYISIVLGRNFFGLGMAVSGAFTLILALYLYTSVIKNIDYLIFSNQPLVNVEKSNWLSRIIINYYGEDHRDE